MRGRGEGVFVRVEIGSSCGAHVNVCQSWGIGEDGKVYTWIRDASQKSAKSYNYRWTLWPQKLTVKTHEIGCLNFNPTMSNNPMMSNNWMSVKLGWAQFLEREREREFCSYENQFPNLAIWEPLLEPAWMHAIHGRNANKLGLGQVHWWTRT